MSIVLLLLLAAASPTPPPSTPLTPLDEVEAWSPVVDVRDVQTTAPARPRTNGEQAVGLIAPVIIGTVISGVPAVLIASFAGSAFFFGAPGLAAATYAVAAVMLGAGPLVAVAIAGGDLPGTTPWLAAGFAVVGGAVVYAATMVTALAVIQPRRDDTLSYTTDTTAELFALLFVPPLLGLAAAAGGGIAATTLGASAE